jgi:L-iditol 2-dehydrogenase
VEEIPRPPIAPGEVLVRVKACGICATDAKTFLRGHPKILPGTVLGHEIAGVIEQVDGTPGWKIGERVVVAPYVPCGECVDCLKGHPTLCHNLFEDSVEPGGFSELIKVPPRIVARGMFRISERISFEEATLAEPSACCYHALEALGLSRGESLLIVGDGTMGILQAEIARSLGAEPIIKIGRAHV